MAARLDPPGGRTAAWMVLGAPVFQGIPRPFTSRAVVTLLFRWIVIACHGTTLYVTWPLWQVRDLPPMLPAIPVPRVDMGWPLVMTLALVLIVPLPGLVMHTALLLYALLADQTRMQPEVISLVLLLWGTLPGETPRTIARAHLIALWFFAGFHKLLSPRFLDGTAVWLLQGFPSRLGLQRWDVVQDNIGYLIAGTEMSLGVLALFPRTRVLAGALALAVHGTILWVLMPTGHDWNEAVWPWNAALAVSGVALIVPWRASLGQSLRRIGMLARVAVVVLLVAPLGFYAGVTDAYLAHHLYSSATARAESSAYPLSATWGILDVPLPPEHRLFRQYFDETCHPGDTLVIRDDRWWYARRGMDQQTFSCAEAGTAG